MTEPSTPDGLYTKVVNLHDKWYREIYVGSAYSWTFLSKIEIDSEQAAAELPER
jgi:hypothetical protein